MTNTYAIRASYERRFDIEADNSFEAQEQARNLLCSYISVATFYDIDTKECEAPTNWQEEAGENGNAVTDDLGEAMSKNF